MCILLTRYTLDKKGPPSINYWFIIFLYDTPDHNSLACTFISTECAFDPKGLFQSIIGLLYYGKIHLTIPSCDVHSLDEMCTRPKGPSSSVNNWLLE